MHGADFNPPLFYLLTRGAQRLFGHGLIATRFPATVGVWVFGLCLFLFVARRTGVVCGFIAGVFPFFTLAQYYAYEARAHGLILGWCGLALLCWQRNAEGRSKYLWLAGFELSLLGALLTHVYAVYLFVPFALVELYNLIKRGRPNWGIICAMLLALVPVVALVYLPLFRMYRSSVRAGFFVPPHERLQGFLVDAIGPALSILLLSLILFGLEGIRRTSVATPTVKIPMSEILVAAGFTCIPLLGFLGSRLSHGPFIDRYFLSSIAGLAIFLGFAHANRQANSWTARALAACMLLLMIGDLGATTYVIAGSHRMLLVEPSSRFVVNTTPSDPMRRYGTVLLDHSDLDILVLQASNIFTFSNMLRALSFRISTLPPQRTMLALGSTRELDSGATSISRRRRSVHFLLATTDSWSMRAGPDQIQMQYKQLLAAAIGLHQLKPTPAALCTSM